MCIHLFRLFKNRHTHTQKFCRSYTLQSENLFHERALCNSSVTSDCLTPQIRTVSVILFVSAVIQSSGGGVESLMNPESSVICSSAALAKCLVLVRQLGFFFAVLTVDRDGTGLVMLQRYLL